MDFYNFNFIYQKRWKKAGEDWVPVITRLGGWIPVLDRLRFYELKFKIIRRKCLVVQLGKFLSLLALDVLHCSYNRRQKLLEQLRKTVLFYYPQAI